VLALDVPKAITNEGNLTSTVRTGGINDLKSVKQENEKM
jgi:hypothetical protein